MNNITFLGTGTSTGIPQIACKCRVCESKDQRDKRLRASALVKIGGQNILIDTGPDMRQQLLKNNISEVDAILITHSHYDHIGGLDDVRPLGSVDIYAEKSVNEHIRTIMPYCFGENLYPGVPKIELHDICPNVFEINGVKIQPIRVMHAKLPILGYRIDDIAYLTDVKTIANEELEKLKDLKVLVLNALREKEHISHITLEEAVVLAKRIDAEQTFFTHASHDLGIHVEVEKKLPQKMHYAFDGLSINF